MAQIPMIVAFEEARQVLTDAANQALSMLPAYQVEILLKQLYDDVFKMAQQEYDTSLAQYQAALAQEKEEVAKAQAPGETDTQEIIENIEEQE